jgi:hypothetical protein
VITLSQYLRSELSGTRLQVLATIADRGFAASGMKTQIFRVTSSTEKPAIFL